MNFFVWIRQTFSGPPLGPPFGPPIPPATNAELANEVKRGLERLDVANAKLEREVIKIKKSRLEMGSILEEAVEAMQKELRK